MATDNQDKEHDRQEANKAASENMERNKEQQDKAYRQSQDKNEAPSLADDDNRPDDALPLKEQNRNRLRDEKDEDFGGEQLQ